MTIQKFTVDSLESSCSMRFLCRIIPPSVPDGRPLVARIGGSEALSTLRINADRVDQSHMLAQLGFATEARSVVPAAFHLVAAGTQCLLHAQWKLRFHADAVGKPLMMKARSVDGGLRVHTEAHPVNHAQQRDGDDRWSARRAGYKAEFSIADQNRRRHGAERAMVWRDGVGVGLH